MIYYVGQFVSVGKRRGLVTDILHDHPSNRHYWVEFGMGGQCVAEWRMRNVSGLHPWWAQRDGVPM